MTATTPMTAERWAESSTVDPAVVTRWPDYQVILVAADDVDVERLTSVHGEPVVDRPDTEEPVWRDETGVTCRRWNWRQTTWTAIGERTTRVGFIIHSLDAPHHGGARRAAQQLAELIEPSHTRTIGNEAGHR